MNGKTQLQLIAHRGWSSVFPENSLPALAAGLAAGADEIEFDLRLTSDGVPILCHDDTVDRVSNLAGPVSSFPADLLGRADIRMPNGDFAVGLGFTLMRSALDLFRGLVDMNIHVKEVHDPGAVLRALALADLTGTSHDVYIAGSPDLLELALDICPSVPRCCLDSYNDPSKTLRAATELKCARVQFRRGRYTDADVGHALDLGLIPNLYYADDVGEAEEAVRSGIVGLLTNDAGPVAKHLRSKGLLAEKSPLRGPRISPAKTG